MSYSVKRSIFTVRDIAQKKIRREKISAITCYDSAFAKIINETDVDLVLVGDSVGNVCLGFDCTIPVTMPQMIHHTSAVSRVLNHAFLCADMPFLSYNLSCEQALENAGKLVQEGGAKAVKLEGGQSIRAQVQAIVSAGIPVMGHLGFTPQSLHAIGGHRVQGRDEQSRKQLLTDAQALEAAGAFAIVLEMVPMDLAKQITQTLKIPTIGIGAGPHCDGQILVLHDILGFDESFSPKFVKKYAAVGSIVRDAVKAYDQDVKRGSFPTTENSFFED